MKPNEPTWTLQLKDRGPGNAPSAAPRALKTVGAEFNRRHFTSIVLLEKRLYTYLVQGNHIFAIDLIVGRHKLA